jgi:hypothetical protein
VTWCTANLPSILPDLTYSVLCNFLSGYMMMMMMMIRTGNFFFQRATTRTLLKHFVSKCLLLCAVGCKSKSTLGLLRLLHSLVLGHSIVHHEHSGVKCPRGTVFVTWNLCPSGMRAYSSSLPIYLMKDIRWDPNPGDQKN